jgi:hypothetical protein
MLDKTITSALLHLRAQIIRDRLDGLGHVNALLVQRGIEPSGQLVRAKRRPDASSDSRWYAPNVKSGSGYFLSSRIFRLRAALLMIDSASLLTEIVG